MTYGRRNFIYHRGAATGSVSAPNKKRSYRNKIAAILGVTVLYTAFLYRSGQSSVSVAFTNFMRCCTMFNVVVAAVFRLPSCHQRNLTGILKANKLTHK